MSNYWECPHCKSVSFMNPKLLRLADVRVAFGKQHIFCPVCGRKINISNLRNGEYNVESPCETSKREEVKGQAIACETWSENDISEYVKQAIADNLDISETLVQPKSRLVEDLGADDLDIVCLIMRFEYDFGINLSDKDMDNLQKQENLTVGALTELIVEKTISFKKS